MFCSLCSDKGTRGIKHLQVLKSNLTYEATVTWLTPYRNVLCHLLNLYYNKPKLHHWISKSTVKTSFVHMSFENTLIEKAIFITTNLN